MLTQEQRRLYATLILLVGVALIALILWLVFGRSGAPVQEPVLPVASQPLKEAIVVPAAPRPAAPTPVVAQAQAVARDFTERFATYSSDAPYANFDDIAPLAASSFFSSLTRSSVTSPQYTGVTARALSLEVESGSEAEGMIVFAVRVQKEQFTKDRLTPTVSYATARVEMIREGGVWKVDGFAWR
jgi:hypothetical protein